MPGRSTSRSYYRATRRQLAQRRGTRSDALVMVQALLLRLMARRVMVMMAAG